MVVYVVGRMWCVKRLGGFEIDIADIPMKIRTLWSLIDADSEVGSSLLENMNHIINSCTNEAPLPYNCSKFSLGHQIDLENMWG